MSAQDESGVYYTPSLGGPNHHPDSQDIQQHPGYPQDALKQCSVKGCTEILPSDDTNKMCVGCRSRHRVYANTKRARRKLEKAAIATAVAARSGKDTEMPLIDPAPQPITWVTAGQSHQDLRPSTSGSTSALSSLSTWNHAIDPRLFSGDVSPTSPHHLSPLMPHQTSTSSELANALTPRKPSTPVPIPTSAILPNQTTTDHNKNYHDRNASQKQSSHLQVSHTPVANRHDDGDSNDNDEEQRVIESLQVTPVQDQQMEVSSSETAELSQGTSLDKVDGSVRSCSVKGCKVVIPASYEYKMCPPCRTRYRTYGTTKRAKWKAERDAFDREMATLSAMEDEKRKAKGLRPLAESPEELRAWELSIIDEQVPVVLVNNSSALPGTSTVVEPGSTQSLSKSPALIPGMNSPVVLAGVYPPSVSSSSTADSPHPISHLNNNPLLLAAASTSLPARMCTVSHCHKILPGYYRYKRCEQHRLQNRHHSQLKRVREREVKGVGSEKVAEIPHEIEAGGKADKDKADKETKQATVALTTAGIEGGKDAGVPFSSTTGGGDSESKKKSHDQKRSKSSCSAGDCHNLLPPSVRWRLCESCRSIDRQRKNQIKSEQKAAAEKEKMNADSQVGVVSANEHTADDDGDAEESQEINHTIPAGAIDPDAEGDIDMGENDETVPKAVENQQSIVSPSLPSMPPTSMTGGFSRFHVTIDPRNASSSAALDPTTSTAQLVTLDDPLAFRAYRPKTTPSAIGRILARNPGLSVDAFTEVLQAEGASTDVMTLSQANVTSTTKSIITPTIPTSAPFVYKAPEKKITPRATVAKGKRKASPERQPTSTTTPATPALVPASASGVTDSTPSAPPGSYGSYGYPQYPYPYPYYMPSPYGIPPYPYSHAPPPAPSDAKKQKSSSKPSTSTAASSSSPTQVPPSTAIPGYSPYPYPYPPPPYGYPPPPNGYPYRYVPGQPPYNGLPPGPSGPNSYPYPYYPFPPPTSAPFPKTAAAARERQRTQDAKFNYYHHGAGSSDSPTTPNNKKRKRRKVDSDYLEKFKAQTQAISISLAMNQAKHGASGSVPTLPLASIASGSSNGAPPVNSAQPVLAVDADADAPSNPITLTRHCANKTCNRSLPIARENTLCDKCRLRFKKHQAKAKKRFKLEPRKFLLIGKKPISGKQGSDSVVGDDAKVNEK